MNITEAYCTNNSRYKAAQIFSPQGVVLHSIGTPQPKARALYNYWQNNGSPYVVHYMVDDTEILHCMPDNYKCWHVCSPGNDKWLGIEMGEPSQIKYTSGSTFTVSDLPAAQAYCEKTYKNAVWLIAYLCKKYGWDPMTQVWTHYEVTMRKLSNTDHTDPFHLFSGLGMGYDLAKLRKDVKAAMGGTSSSSNSGSSSSSSSSSSSNSNSGSSSSSAMYRIRKSWADAASQIGAYSSLENAKKAWKEGYYIFDSNGNVIYPKPLAVGSEVHLVAGATYTNGQAIPAWVINSTLYVREVRGSDIVFSTLKTGAVTGVAAAKYFKEASSSTSSSTSASSYIVTVTASSLNIRSGPGTSYPVVGSIAKGGAYTIVETSGNWGLLKSYEKDRNGWICLDYTEKV